jgi:hypothetical protein
LWNLGAGCLLGDAIPVRYLPLQLDRQVMEDVGNKLGRMLNAEASRNRTMKGQDDQVEEEATIDGLAKKYPWWSHTTSKGWTTEP